MGEEKGKDEEDKAAWWEPLPNNNCPSLSSPCSINYFSFAPYMQSKAVIFKNSAEYEKNTSGGKGAILINY